MNRSDEQLDARLRDIALTAVAANRGVADPETDLAEVERRSTGPDNGSRVRTWAEGSGRRRWVGLSVAAMAAVLVVGIVVVSSIRDDESVIAPPVDTDPDASIESAPDITTSHTADVTASSVPTASPTTIEPTTSSEPTGTADPQRVMPGQMTTVTPSATIDPNCAGIVAVYDVDGFVAQIDSGQLIAPGSPPAPTWPACLPPPSDASIDVMVPDQLEPGAYVFCLDGDNVSVNPAGCAAVEVVAGEPSDTAASTAVTWFQLPPFAFAGSTHTISFSFDDSDARDVSVAANGQPGTPATFDSETGRWSAQLTAPTPTATAGWDIDVTATTNDGAVTDSVTVAVLDPPGPELPVRLSDATPELMAVFASGDGPDELGVGGDGSIVEAPTAITYASGTNELVIVDHLNDRLLVTDASGRANRTIPLPVEGTLEDLVELPDQRLLVAEFRRAAGPETVAHIVDLTTDHVTSTEPTPVPSAPTGVQLRLDEPSGIVYAQFGGLYPYYDTATGRVAIDGRTEPGWQALVTADGLAGIQSFGDYLAARFPVSPAIEQVEFTGDGFWVDVSGVDGDQVRRWIAWYPLDGSEIVATPVPYHRFEVASSTFAVSDTGVVSMILTDTGLELWQARLESGR